MPKPLATLALIKSGAVARHDTGLIIASVESQGFHIPCLRKFMRLGEYRARAFYAEHEGRPYFADLLASVTGAAGIVAMVLTHAGTDDVISLWRNAMGPTDPWNTPGWSLRHRFRGPKMPDNALHGSDSAENFEREFDILFEGHWL